MLIPVIMIISLALVFYTVGVWGEKLSGGLKSWILSMFWLGLIMDSTGNAMISSMSQSFE